MIDEGAEMNTKADKVAGIALGIIFFAMGIASLFMLPAEWRWYQDVMFGIAIFGCSLGCFAAVFFGVPGSRK